ncbi:hypothetical protein U9M73_08690 [Paenibacillus phoenicis]|uniref:Uncharacterized protein n=1 Tax=Paenibacillus phoenicis TaxID=554117 RepID=A0ABU5PJK5_9BACL|nr:MULTISPECIES: hypothetical protein [Paenibacillus]MCT2195631.1 hypothetical protein [Paenibacillus sp. p3-SID1389]MEA3570080.1 hypothetical protein [Paenibacillus phoenicis]
MKGMPPAPLETEEDLQLVKEYILLPVLLNVLERDMKALGTVKLKMDVVYVRALRTAQDLITADLTLLRKKMRDRGIKVFEQQRTELGIEARYLCRGYQHRFSMLWSLVKAELNQYLSKYLNVDLRSDGL